MQLRLIVLYLMLVTAQIMQAVTTDPHVIEKIKNKLAEMVNTDQKIRANINYSNLDQLAIHEMRKVDEYNVATLKNILESCNEPSGWLTISKFGTETDHHAWLLVQHADHDLVFQKIILARLATLYSIHETNPQNFAYLYDRIAVAEHRPQKYGTQGLIQNGQWIPYEIEEPNDLDARRRAMGLSTHKEYTALLTQIK